MTNILTLLLLGLAFGQDPTNDAIKPEGKRYFTKEEVEQRAKEADMSIQFIKPSEFKEFVSSGTRFVFFGATWCKYCKRLSPRWLRLQESIKKSSKMQSYDLKLAKLDCTEEHEFCEMHGAPAYPTLMLYHNGRFEEEYTGDHQTKQMGDYLLQKLETLAPAHREL